MSENVKIYEIARKIGISSSELVDLCERAGFDEITHHSNAVSPEKAEEIRKAAIRLYKPKEEPDKTKKTKKPKKTKKKKKPEKKSRPIPTTEHVKPVAPPKPKGRHAPREKKEEEKESGGPKQKAAGREEKKKEERDTGEKEEEKGGKTTRTVIFKQREKPPETERASEIEVTLPVTLRELSEKMGVSASELIKTLMLEHQIRANINQTLEREVIELLGLEYDIEINFEAAKTAEDILEEYIPEDNPDKMETRPPVIALLGHVDHGKTSILDCVRDTSVAEQEDGGITQDIGAWQMEYEGQRVTFVDTPGHEAFTAMRARGAQVTDVVILVVAADDGVMAQTEEAISHARAAEVPIVVALNKIDKPEANTMQVLQQLAKHELNAEEWGGETGCVEVCALTGEGINELLERTLLEAEILELEADPTRPADGAVLESRMEEGLGVVANVIVRGGHLEPGDIMVCGPAHGRVRSLLGQRGQEISYAGPSTPVAVSGLDRVPEAGDPFVVVKDLDVAREVAEERIEKMEQERRRPRSHITLENLYQSLAAGEEEQLRVVVKGDVKGSLEPLVNSLEQLGTDDEVSVRVLHRGVGPVNVSDVLLADASDAVVIAFRVGMEERAREEARETGVDIRYFRVIYEAIQEVKDALEGLLEPERREERVGVAEVRQIFRISSVGNIAGCYVRDGVVKRGSRVRLVRDGTVVHEGRIESLRREKNDAREVESGYECGIKLQNYNDIEVGDLIECYTVREVKRALS